MKKFWKFLGITALAAALVPYRVRKDELTGETRFEALLWQGKKSIRNGERRVDVNVAPWFSPFRTDDPGAPDAGSAGSDFAEPDRLFSQSPVPDQPQTPPVRPEE